MKDRTWKLLVACMLLSSMAWLSGTARAEHVQAETPFFSGLPLESLTKGSASSSLNTTQLVWGTSLTVNALAATGRGTFSIRLQDIEWPEALQTLTLLVTDMKGIWRKLDGPGDLLVDVNGPSKLFAAVFAKSESKYMPGLYNLKVDFAPAVPLPAAVWLLLSGLGGLAALRRRTVST